MFESRKANSYVPDFYANFVEMEALVTVEDELGDKAESEIRTAYNNQFTVTSEVEGIESREKMLGITPNLALEDLEFRRQRILNRLSTTPPFSFAFLKKKFDEIIGVNAWTAYVDYSTNTLYVESSASNQIWFNEILITVTNLKPANLVFINTPLISNGVDVSEKIDSSEVRRNYWMGTWTLGLRPFVDYFEEGVIKMSTIPSVKNALLGGMAEFTHDEVASVLINDTLSITIFDEKTVEGNVATVAYLVPKDSVPEITSVKLRNSLDEVLTSVNVYIPVIDTIRLKHSITIKEGV